MGSLAVALARLEAFVRASDAGFITITAGLDLFYQSTSSADATELKRLFREAGGVKKALKRSTGLTFEDNEQNKGLSRIIMTGSAQAKAKQKWKATRVDGATCEGGSAGGGNADRPADQRAPPCKFFAQGACSFGDRCRFRHDRTSSSAQSSASDPRWPPATQLKCNAEVVKLKRKADGARAATA